MTSDVIIIGAGAAGLMTARELRRAGKTVTILEASNRIGGRAMTLDIPRAGVPVELGASFVHGEAPETKKLLDEARLVSVPVIGDQYRSEHGRFSRQGPIWSRIALVFKRMLHNGMDLNLGGDVHDVWWDVGNAARKSRADKSIPIANADQNWTAWMYLGWSFDPSKHSSSYLGGGFRQLGFMRQATFVALRSEVARPRNSMSIYEDALNAVKFSPNAWATSVATFGLRHLNERLAAGEKPATADLLATARAQVSSLVNESYKKISVADRAKVDALAQPVLSALQ